MTSPSAEHAAEHATGLSTGHAADRPAGQEPGHAPARQVESADGAAELADALTRAMKRIRRRTMDSLEPYGITPAQGRALRTLAHHSTDERAIRLSELADLLHIAPRSATTVVDALEQAELVERVPDPADRRAVGLVLTTGGLAAMERLAQVRQQVAEDYFGAADPADLAVMLRVLRNAEAACPAPSLRHGHGRHRTT